MCSHCLSVSGNQRPTTSLQAAQAAAAAAAKQTAELRASHQREAAKAVALRRQYEQLEEEIAGAHGRLAGHVTGSEPVATATNDGSRARGGRLGQREGAVRQGLLLELEEVSQLLREKNAGLSREVAELRGREALAVAELDNAAEAEARRAAELDERVAVAEREVATAQRQVSAVHVLFWSASS